MVGYKNFGSDRHENSLGGEVAFFLKSFLTVLSISLLIFNNDVSLYVLDTLDIRYHSSTFIALGFPVLL